MPQFSLNRKSLPAIFNSTRNLKFSSLPISWRGTLIQYAGRLHRLNAAKKDVIIYDYVDIEVPVLAEMSSRRRAGYKAIGYEIMMADSKQPVSQLVLENLCGCCRFEAVS